jgi:prolyl-tRNA synthetase
LGELHGLAIKLGTRYSLAMDFTVDVSDGSTRPVVMGSYGIGVTRLVQTLIEQHADENGCRWPVTDAGTVAPFDAAIVPLAFDGELRETAEQLHHECGDRETLLFDDPEQTIGERFAESDLLGIPLMIVLGNTFLDTGDIEVETRDRQTQYVTIEEVSAIVTEQT